MVQRGRRYDAHLHPARDLEAQQRRPHRDPSDVALRAVDRVDDPATLAPAGAAELLADDRVAGPGRGESLTQEALDGAVGLGDRGQVGLGFHGQVVGQEAAERDLVGQPGQLEGESEIVRCGHGRRMLRTPDAPRHPRPLG